MARGRVAGDGKEPGREGTGGIVARQSPPGLAESLLRQVFGVLAMTGEDPQEVEDLRLKTQDNLLEGGHAALRGQAGQLLRAEFRLV